MTAMPKSEHLRKQKEFVDEKIKNNTKESAKQRLIEAGILDKNDTSQTKRNFPVIKTEDNKEGAYRSEMSTSGFKLQKW